MSEQDANETAKKQPVRRSKRSFEDQTAANNDNDGNSIESVEEGEESKVSSKKIKKGGTKKEKKKRYGVSI